MEEKKDKLGTIKGFVGIVAGIGVTTLFTNIVKATMPPGAKLTVQLGATIGGAVLGKMFGEQAGEYLDRKIDETAEKAKKFLGTEDKKPEPEEEVAVAEA